MVVPPEWGGPAPMGTQSRVLLQTASLNAFKGGDRIGGLATKVRRLPRNSQAACASLQHKT
ncbi:hypothetical protein J2X68_007563 [Streptomyces sp. 3330]|nr:hypothetical protein [Streptomyces sp. 3330]